MTDTITLPEPKVKRSQKVRLQPRYNVILLNDDEHTHDYVIEMLAALFKHSLETGFKMAQKVHEEGRVIVFTATLELAELKQEQIHTYGADYRIPTCKGSMSAELEPTE